MADLTNDTYREATKLAETDKRTREAVATIERLYSEAGRADAAALMAWAKVRRMESALAEHMAEQTSSHRA